MRRSTKLNFEKMKKEVAKRKEWTTPGIDEIQNYWCKKLEPTLKALTRAFTKIKEDNTNIPIWWPTGRTVYYQKAKTWRIRRITGSNYDNVGSNAGGKTMG